MGDGQDIRVPLKMSFLRKQESSPALDGIEITGIPPKFTPYFDTKWE